MELGIKWGSHMLIAKENNSYAGLNYERPPKTLGN